MASIATLRAASRVTPRMAMYRLKRTIRNGLVGRYPTLYKSHVDRTAKSVPPLKITSDTDAVALPQLAEYVAEYYYAEYIDSIVDASNGRFTYFGRTVDFGSVEEIDWNHQLEDETDFHLWRMKLAHMGFVCPMLMSGDDSHLRSVERLLSAYRHNSTFGSGCFSSYWFPYSVSHRILAILSGYVLGRRRYHFPDSLCSEIETFLRWNVGFLLENIEHELRNNHVERNLAALCMYYHYASSCPVRISHRLDREVRRYMDACILSDGLNIERSAMYHGLSVMALGVFADAECLTVDTRRAAGELHEKAIRAWQFLTHPDGDISLFNDSWIGEVPQVASIRKMQEFAPLELLPDAGYARLQSDSMFCLMDAGPIGPRWNPGHGHADFLALEVDIATKRFVVDPGTYQYSTGPRRSFERSASSHNGPAREGLEPVEYLGCFRVGRLHAAELTAVEELDDGGKVGGRLQLSGDSAFERHVELMPDRLRVSDHWFGDASGAFVRLMVPASWVVDRHDSRSVWFHDDGVRVALSVLDGRVVEMGSGQWASRYLESRDAISIVLQPLSRNVNCSLIWEVLEIT